MAITLNNSQIKLRIETPGEKYRGSRFDWNGTITQIWYKGKKMLAGEKTDLIQGFRSTKTHRLFDAYLLLDAKTGKIKFEFPPRIPGKGHRFAKKKAEE